MSVCSFTRFSSTTQSHARASSETWTSTWSTVAICRVSIRECIAAPTDASVTPRRRRHVAFTGLGPTAMRAHGGQDPDLLALRLEKVDRRSNHGLDVADAAARHGQSHDLVAQDRGVREKLPHLPEHRRAHIPFARPGKRLLQDTERR